MTDLAAIADALDALGSVCASIAKTLRADGPAPAPPPPPLAPTKRKINDAGLALVREWEGLVLTADPDITGLLTIGYGHTGSDVYAGQTITEAIANTLLWEDLAGHSEFVAAHASTATDNQFAAMVSLAFNVGNAGFGRSTVLRQHNAGDFAAAADAFLLWDKAHVDGELVVVAGLHNRRVAEAALYLTP